MGSYIEASLGPKERLIYEAKNHWIIFISLKSFFTLFIAPLIEFFTNEFGITNKRVICKSGLISRKTLEINIGKIESILVHQGILGRLLGYGSIVVVGTGGTKEPFYYISNPINFRKTFQRVADGDIEDFENESDLPRRHSVASEEAPRPKKSKEDYANENTTKSKNASTNDPKSSLPNESKNRHIVCLNCNARYKAPENIAKGKKIKCPKCNGTITV